MGVRLIGDMARHRPCVPAVRGGPGVGALGASSGVPGGRFGSRVSDTPTFRLVYDGTAGKEGLPAALGANEIWIDPTELIRPGSTQVSLTAMYAGPLNCVVSGCLLPSDYAYKVGDASIGAAIFAEGTAQFETIATLAPNAAANLFAAKPPYTLYRLIFGAGAGQVVMTSI